MLPEGGTRVGNTGGGPALGVADLRYEHIPATADQLPQIRHALAAWAQQIGAEDVEAVVQATYEAMANVVAHAYPHHRGTFDLHATYRPDQQYMTVTVSDHGHWRPPPAHLTPQRGNGLRLIRALAADTTVDPRAQGTTIRMRWTLPGHSPRSHSSGAA